MTMIDMTVPANARYVRLVALRGHLRLNARGLRTRGGSKIKIAQEMGYTGPRTAMGALAWVEAQIAEMLS